jgi:ABC-type enterochelin transport system substrate-binding protein
MKKKAYLKYISEPSIEQLAEYREFRNRVDLRIRQIKEGYWESFTADMEHDIYGAQKKVWKLIRKTKKEVNELVTNNKITIGEWEIFFETCTGGQATT